MSQDLRVIKIDPQTGRISFKVSPQPIDGMDLLVQVVVLSLLNVPGQDVLDPDDGGGFPEMVAMNIDAADSTEVTAEIMRRVKKSETEIIAAQTGLDLIPEARLSQLHIVSISPGESIDEFLVKIRVINASGQSIDIVA